MASLRQGRRPVAHDGHHGHPLAPLQACRDFLFMRVRLERQTGKAISRCTLPSDFKNITCVFLSTPKVPILLITQVVLLALLIIWSI